MPPARFMNADRLILAGGCVLSCDGSPIFHPVNRSDTNSVRTQGILLARLSGYASSTTRTSSLTASPCPWPWPFSPATEAPRTHTRLCVPLTSRQPSKTKLHSARSNDSTSTPKTSHSRARDAEISGRNAHASWRLDSRDGGVRRARGRSKKGVK